jgi:hypothetical protein
LAHLPVSRSQTCPDACGHRRIGRLLGSATRGVEAQPCQYIRGQGGTAGAAAEDEIGVKLNRDLALSVCAVA